jgi:GNAT superfamily N-acetyltransferase
MNALPIRISPARKDDLRVAELLFREYARSLPFSLEYQGFEQEMTSLPGKYARPHGEILLAFLNEAPVGCVAMRPLPLAPGYENLHVGDRVCEMKRFYVTPHARGHGLGQMLARQIVRIGRELGYTRMKLDTSGDMHAAARVYESVGFVRCARYNDDPDQTTVYFELDMRET